LTLIAEDGTTKVLRMASITLRDVPEDVLQMLGDAALRNQRSPEEEAVDMLKANLGSPCSTGTLRTPEQIEARIAMWRRIAAMCEPSVDFETEVAMIYAARRRGREVDA